MTRSLVASSWTRVALIVAAAVGFIELLLPPGRHRSGFTHHGCAPSQMALELVRMMASGELSYHPRPARSWKVGVAFAVSVLAGATLGALVHAQPRRACAVHSILYWRAGMRCRSSCSIHCPGGVIRFERTAVDRYRRDIRRARHDAEALSPVSKPGAARVMRKVARVHRLSQILQEVRLITLPSAAPPHLFTGAEARLRILRSSASSPANSSSPAAGSATASPMPMKVSSNRTMYALMLFVLLIATGVNGALQVWDGRLARAAGGRA